MRSAVKLTVATRQKGKFRSKCRTKGNRTNEQSKSRRRKRRSGRRPEGKGDEEQPEQEEATRKENAKGARIMSSSLFV